MRKLLIIIGCLLYVLSPIDLCPDFIPGLGQIDDLIAIVMAARSVFSKRVDCKIV